MITLQVNGEDRSYSQRELTTILEEYYSGKAEKPTEGKWYQVNPRTITIGLFENERSDKRQELIRKIILEAFVEAHKNSKYYEPFETMVPNRTEEHFFEKELKILAQKIGDSQTDWVEQALEWAQRISNGETWENLCNKPDYNKWFRLIVGKNDESWIIGGSTEGGICVSASNIMKLQNYFDCRLWYAVPSVVRRKKRTI